MAEPSAPSVRRLDRGSSLVLMPAAVLVFVVLGAFAVDFAAVQLGQRELVAAAQGAANDAAAAGYDTEAFYEEGEIRFDRDAAYRAAAQSLAVNDDQLQITSFRTTDGAVVLTVSGTVPTIFSKAVPGAPDRIYLDARASADLSR